VDKTIGNFVGALRKADIPVSPAETLDAMAALEIVGVDDKRMLRDTLSIILAKTPEEKELFDLCFNRFFSFRQFSEHPEFLSEINNQYSEVQNSDTSSSFENSEKDPDEVRQRRSIAHHSSYLGHMLLSGNSDELSIAMKEAGESVSLDQIKTLRERSIFARRILIHLGLGQLDDEIKRLQSETDDKSLQTAALLSRAKEYLQEQVRDYVEGQYLLIVDGSGDRFIIDALTQSKLTNVQVYYFDRIRETIRKLAHQLAKRHAKKKKVQNRGQLDIRKTLRKNQAYDGAMFELCWKQTKTEHPKIFVLCDVSGSVKNVARFLLTFLYGLNEVLPGVRSFVFSGELGEVTDYFESYNLEEAIEMSLKDYGKGSTDYGQAFHAFRDLCIRDIDSRSTIIILGDARNNYFGNGSRYLKEVSKKSRQVIWLNPEQRSQWLTGDSEMQSYLPACHFADVCNSLPDLQRIVSRVMRSAQ
jgi:uncharacterized protein with von Willebrand factor type A (vWA) domain